MRRNEKNERVGRDNVRMSCVGGCRSDGMKEETKEDKRKMETVTKQKETNVKNKEAKKRNDRRERVCEGQ